MIPLQEDADIIRNTLKRDNCKTEEEALSKIYGLIRAGRAFPRRDARARS